MEETIVQIPQETQEGWQPPVIEKRLAEKVHAGSAADVFFMQYTVCILLLTAVLVLRLLDDAAYTEVADTFARRTAAPDTGWAAAALDYIRTLWA
ncbi:MAG: hypothetical protein IJ595_11450 [Oscillospiraceae bacterium]|nr:hypothetical protein [Oscillospiraceae bacterium]